MALLSFETRHQAIGNWRCLVTRTVTFFDSNITALHVTVLYSTGNVEYPRYLDIRR